MSYFKNFFFLIVLLSAIGCGKVVIDKTVLPKIEETKRIEAPEKKWYTPWRKTKEELEKEYKLKKEQEYKLKEQYKNTQTKVEEIFDKIKVNLSKDGFFLDNKIEVFDAWNNLIQVNYDQKMFKDTLTVVSKGKDCK